MLKFSQLSLAQKRFVVAVIEYDSNYKTNPQITLKDVSGLCMDLYSKRTGAKGEKVGYPNWLFKTNKVERGLYQLPIPTDKELSDYQVERDLKLNPVKKAKVKVARLAKAKVVMSKAGAARASAKSDDEDADINGTRLHRIIAESEPIDSDIEDFNQILRDNGIEVN